MQVEVEWVLRSTGELARVSGEVGPDRYGYLVVAAVRAVAGGVEVGLRPRELYDVGCCLRTAYRLGAETEEAA